MRWLPGDPDGHRTGAVAAGRGGGRGAADADACVGAGGGAGRGSAVAVVGCGAVRPAHREADVPVLESLHEGLSTAAVGASSWPPSARDGARSGAGRCPGCAPAGARRGPRRGRCVHEVGRRGGHRRAARWRILRLARTTSAAGTVRGSEPPPDHSKSVGWSTVGSCGNDRACVRTPQRRAQERIALPTPFVVWSRQPAP